MNMEDPLALLEAEYAAVLAQTRPSELGGEDSKDAQPHEDDRMGFAGEASRGSDRNNRSDSGSEESDAEEEGADATYSLLPSSPGGGALGGFDSDEEDDEEGDAAVKEDGAKGSETQRAAATLEMPADKRQTIMQAMQKLQLQPPAWAAANPVSDDQLVAMVQRQLKSKE